VWSDIWGGVAGDVENVVLTSVHSKFLNASEQEENEKDTISLIKNVFLQPIVPDVWSHTICCTHPSFARVEVLELVL